MSKRAKTIWAVVMLVCAALLMLAFFPRSFEQAIDAKIDDISKISVNILPYGDGEDRQAELTPEDPAFGDLLDLLNREKYTPLVIENVQYHVLHTVQSHGSPWDSYLFLALYLSDRSVRIVHMDGSEGVQFEMMYRPAGGEEFQREVLEFLLEQAEPVE